MSAQDVEVVRQAYEALGRRPDPDLEVVLRLYAPDHVLVSEWGSGDNKTYHGLEGFRQALADAAELFEEFENEVEELVDAGDGVVVATIRGPGRGRRSGAPVDQRLGAVIRLSGGRIVHTRYYVTPDAAFAAVGA